MKAVLSSLADPPGAGLRPVTPLAVRLTMASVALFLVCGDARSTVCEADLDHVPGPSTSAHRLTSVSPPTLSKALDSLKAERTPGG